VLTKIIKRVKIKKLSPRATEKDNIVQHHLDDDLHGH